MNVSKNRIAFAKEMAEELGLKVKSADFYRAFIVRKDASEWSMLRLQFDGYQSFTIDRLTKGWGGMEIKITISRQANYNDFPSMKEEIVKTYNQIIKAAEVWDEEG